ncbi:JAB domain-containing protein [Rubripirellula reticaptiva]|nr:JAB domain-containing protein [Rubripirellula reticaptiva]
MNQHNLTQEVAQSISKVIAYLSEEEMDFLENPTETHIQHSIRKIETWFSELTGYQAIPVEASSDHRFIREVNVQYRLQETKREVLRDAKQVAGLTRLLLPDNSREHFLAFYLDGSHQIASYSVISTGTANATLVYPREIFQRAVLTGAVSVILAHNHPSGSVQPSESDFAITKKLIECGEVLKIAVLDHVVVSDQGFTSLREESSLW